MIFRIPSNSILSKLLKFAGIGLVNTGIHTSIVVTLVELLRTSPTIANAIAFMAANAFSYWANRRWNFRTNASIQQYTRFLFVSLAGLAITILVSSIADRAGLHYLIGLALVFIALPTLTFILHYRWTFRS